MTTDQNLLFGVLALQADLLAPAQFAEACAAWAARKDTALADLLVERGWLTPGDRADVERLLQRKLRKHHGDVRASLAEITTVHVRHSVAAVDDPDVRHTFTGLTPPPAGHVLLATIDHVPESRDRYTLSRLHATGGLGRVWLARDASLGRDVALKELRPERVGHPSVWARFLKEAQITGQLEHPGIVPVYELSRRPDNDQPFYTMRFVRGRTLAEAARAYHERRSRGEASPLELRELLTAFVGVCHAVAYAHSRGVLHRDLKPQNVVLGDFGEVMVLDWGLAKVLGEPETGEADAEPADRSAVVVPATDDAARTVAGQVLGTPAYMAPEQAEGRHDQVGPRTDVYGLGAILYEVLTGHMPFGGADTQAVLRRVIHDAPRPPRASNPQAPAPLSAVCQQALAKRPAERYATAQDLADDVKRWLADEPVTAYREPFTVRAGRWVRRHRTLVSSTAAMLLVGALSLLVATVLLAHANEEIRSKNQALADANAAIAAAAEDREQQRLVAVELARKAMAAHQQAEERLDQSVDALKLFAHDARDFCEDALVPGASKKALFEVLRAQLDRQAAAAEEVKDFNVDKARARCFLYETVALIQIELAQTIAAEATLKKALRVADQWLAALPGDPAALGRRAAVLHLFGTVHERRYNPVVANRYFNEAYALRRQLLGNPTVERFTPAKTRLDLGDSLEALGRWEEALQLRRAAYDQVLKHIAEHNGKPADASFALNALNWTYQKAAVKTGDVLKRREYLDKANETSAALVALRKDSRPALERWAKNLLFYGELEQRQADQAATAGQDAQAKQHLATARQQFTKLAELARQLATSADLLKERRQFAEALYVLGQVEQLLGQQPRAEGHFKHCLAVREEVLRDYPRDRFSISMQLDRLDVLLPLGRFAEVAAAADRLMVKYADKITLYRLASLYARCIPAIEQARRPAALTPADLAQQRSYRAKALDCLERSVRSGFDDWDELRHGPALRPVRDDPRFKAILKMEK